MAVQPSMPLLPLNADGQGPTFEMATENSSKGKEEMFPFLFSFLESFCPVNTVTKPTLSS